MHALAISSLIGCSTNETSPSSSTDAPVSVVDATLLEKTWQSRMADAGQRARFESDPGWGSTFQRRYGQALSSFGEDAGKARIHFEYAALYRHAVLMFAHATHHVYGESREATDPAEMDYLLGVSRWFRADDGVDAAFEALPETAAVELRARADAWSAVESWPPSLGEVAFPDAPAALQPGSNPGLDSLPHVPGPNIPRENGFIQLRANGVRSLEAMLTRMHVDRRQACPRAHCVGIFKPALRSSLSPAAPRRLLGFPRASRGMQRASWQTPPKPERG